MGVKGLNDYLEGKDSRGRYLFARAISIFGIRKIIIDGSNLRFSLYKAVDNGRYGGEYALYARAVRKFFHILRWAEIEPYIVFDGFVRQKGDARTSRLDQNAAELPKLKSAWKSVLSYC